MLEDDERLESNMAEVAGRHDTVWVVYADSEDDQRSNPAVEDWLRQHAFPGDVEWLGNARVTRYSTATVSLQPHPLEASSAAQIELAGCAFDEGPIQPAEVLHVSLSWRALEPLENDYAVFVHLTDEGERVWAQHDGQPVGGSRPTSSWEPGEKSEITMACPFLPTFLRVNIR